MAFAHAAGWSQSGAQEGVFSARSRQLEALSRADQALGFAAGHLQLQALELLAEQLRLAQQHLSEITGEYLAMIYSALSLVSFVLASRPAFLQIGLAGGSWRRLWQAI